MNGDRREDAGMRSSGPAAAKRQRRGGLDRSAYWRVLLTMIGSLVLALLWTLPAQEARLALVIGNDRYQYIKTLDNAAKDAVAIGKALRAIGQTAEKQPPRPSPLRARTGAASCTHMTALDASRAPGAALTAPGSGIEAYSPLGSPHCCCV